jgi:hypothetical protein
VKITILGLCLLTAGLAFAQSSGGGYALNADARPVEFSSHPERAMQHPLGSEQSVLETSEFVWAHGEVPLWEVAQKKEAVSLGEVARVWRKEHEKMKKADTVWTN